MKYRVTRRFVDDSTPAESYDYHSVEQATGRARDWLRRGYTHEIIELICVDDNELRQTKPQENKSSPR